MQYLSKHKQSTLSFFYKAGKHVIKSNKLFGLYLYVDKSLKMDSPMASFPEIYVAKRWDGTQWRALKLKSPHIWVSTYSISIGSFWPKIFHYSYPVTCWLWSQILRKRFNSRSLTRQNWKRWAVFMTSLWACYHPKERDLLQCRTIRF